MPHSVETSESVRDTIIPDAVPEPENVDPEITEEITVSNGDSQPVENAEEDITMAEPGAQGDLIPDVIVKPEVKLEDLFADIESDEEFPSSVAKEIKVASSPEAPASPV